MLPKEVVEEGRNTKGEKHKEKERREIEERYGKMTRRSRKKRRELR